MKTRKYTEENIFTQMDHAIIRSAVKKLPGLLSVVVEMRFWKQLTLDDISLEIGVSTEVIEVALVKAARILREECLRHPAFSRSKHSLIENLRLMAAA